MVHLLALCILFFPNISFSKETVRECAKPERWAPSMVQVHLKNAGIIRNEDIDFSKTKVTLLAQEKIKKDLYRQIQKVTYVKKNGEEITAITDNEASSEECSMSPVKVYLIQREFGP